MGAARARWILPVALALSLPAGRAGAQWRKNEYQLQRDAAAQYEPAPLTIAHRAEGRPIEILRLRFYADDEYRAGGASWKMRVQTELGDLNRIVEPAFAVRFEAESFRRWDRRSGKGALAPMLSEL